MKYIIVQEDYNSIGEAENAILFLKKVVESCTFSSTKVFNILADSGEMTISELVDFANTHILNGGSEISSIYELGEQIV